MKPDGQRGARGTRSADFVDQDGRQIDVDFLVIPVGEELRTTQAIVHSVDGKKRKYHLE